jgi:hypothetical protein
MNASKNPSPCSSGCYSLPSPLPAGATPGATSRTCPVNKHAREGGHGCSGPGAMPVAPGQTHDLLLLGVPCLLDQPELVLQVSRRRHLARGLGEPLLSHARHQRVEARLFRRCLGRETVALIAQVEHFRLSHQRPPNTPPSTRIANQPAQPHTIVSSSALTSNVWTALPHGCPPPRPPRHGSAHAAEIRTSEATSAARLGWWG